MEHCVMPGEAFILECSNSVNDSGDRGFSPNPAWELTALPRPRN